VPLLHDSTRAAAARQHACRCCTTARVPLLHDSTRASGGAPRGRAGTDEC
jgi:hypothetical protein